MKVLNVVAVSLLLLGGCAGQEAVKPETANDGRSTATTTGSATGAQPNSAESLLNQRNAYFAYDSTSIDADARALIKAHAQHLTKQPNVAVSLDGHCDERGTREYNLRLGERRAQAVANLMQAMGVASKRISINSFGKEKPVCSDHDEACWQKNRRVEVIYR